MKLLWWLLPLGMLYLVFYLGMEVFPFGDFMHWTDIPLIFTYLIMVMLSVVFAEVKNS